MIVLLLQIHNAEHLQLAGQQANPLLLINKINTAYFL
jgi:hypothetical protein